ncbi:MAG TPA: glycosyltransferase family 2 protein [Clostridia bacterium]|nr:glycosyltransferase family 2 protein [Clostridia bacterium]
MTLSVAIITFNEEANIARTLRSVAAIADEIVIVDSGSNDRTVEIAQSFGPHVRVLSETWKGFARQKNSAIEKCTGIWVLSLDADEELTPELAKEISEILSGPAEDGFGKEDGYWIKRRNHFLNKPIRHGGFYPDPKLRLFRRGKGRFLDRPVHETMEIEGRLGTLHYPMNHHAYPTLSGYIEHMNRYSSLGAQVAVSRRRRGFSVLDIVLRPLATFLYNYLFRLGFLDGREGLLLHMYHSVYVSWKYAKAWEIGQDR